MVISIDDDGLPVDEPRNEHLNRASMRLERLERRRRIRNTLILVGVVLLMGAVAAVVVTVLTMNGSGLNAPGIVGMKYFDAKKKVESVGLFIEIDSMQDSSAPISCLMTRRNCLIGFLNIRSSAQSNPGNGTIMSARCCAGSGRKDNIWRSIT